MKILFCKGGIAGSVSGADQILVNYALHLRSAGHHPSVIVTYPYAEDNQYAVRLRGLGVPVTCVTQNTSYSFMRGLRRLILAAPAALTGKARGVWERWQEPVYRAALGMMRRVRPDVAHVLEPWGETPTLIRAAHDAGVPVIYHDFGTPGAIPGRERDYDELTDVISMCSEVAGLSPALARMCRERFKFAGRASALPLIADNTPAGGARAASTQGVTFGYAARLEELKGPLILLEAFAEVLRAFPGARLKLAGDGPQKAEAHARAEALGIGHSCEFVGAYVGVEAKDAFMRSLDVLVHPSLTEGTPNVIIEAMAHGLPVVATAVGGVPDMVSAESGVLVPAGEVAPLAGAMTRLASEPSLRAGMGRAARRGYEVLFTPEAVLPLLLRAYRRVVEKGADAKRDAAHGSELPAHPWAPRT
jgi:glycosyltransferase involved in cell wall biosynthesis